MIELKNISVLFGDKKVLDDISFTISEGEIIGLVAPNGTGKSTLLNVLMNYLVPSKGIVSFDGKTYQTKKQEKAIHEEITLMPDQSDLYYHLSGRDHLTIYHKMWSKTSLTIDEVITQLNMTSYIDKKVGQYSLGMKQRLCFAMQIVANTTYLLMDEVMNGLDPANVTLISNMLIKKREEGKTVVIASHLLENLSLYTDRVFFLKEGKIMKEIKATDKKEAILKFKKSNNDINRIGTYEVFNLPNGTSYIRLNEEIGLTNELITSLRKLHILEYSVTHLDIGDWYAHYFE